MSKFTRRDFLKDSSVFAAAARLKAQASPSDVAGERAPAARPPAKDIRKLSQHFNDPGADISPWMFLPKENLKEVSTEEHPGLVTVWQAGTAKDIKGILEHPIHIEEYPLPWEFELSLVQNYFASLFGEGDPKQNNYAIGFNLAVTFSDPATWPADRSQQPPDTHSFQLFVVHLGATSEYSAGLPQFAAYRLPENFLVWGRGDLAIHANGDWGVPYIFAGTMPNGGAASAQIFFRAFLQSPTQIHVGIKFREQDDFIERAIDCSNFGRITGIWEIGPIFSCDRWIPDQLCKQLKPRQEVANPPEPIAPNPMFEFYVDYCVFMLANPAAPFEYYSDDFNILGYLGQWRGFQLPFSAETWSNPGYLTITLLGANQGVWFGPRTLNECNLDHYEPPWEMEICFIAPDDSIPWNVFFHHQLYDSSERFIGYWGPGVQNFPNERRHRFVNYPYASSTFDALMPEYLKHFAKKSGPNTIAELRPRVKVEFEREIPEHILAHKPLAMLYQLIDRCHVRIGFRGSRKYPWYLSKVFDLSTIAEGGIGKISESCWSMVTGRHFHLPSGSPQYQKLLIDYVNYRSELTPM